MKNLSIKSRIILWFGMLMLIITVSVLILMFSVGSSLIDSDTRSILIEAVEDSLDDIEYDDGELEIDISFFSEGVYLQIYDTETRFIDGYLPADFTDETKFSDKNVQKVTASGEQYYVYDRKLTFKKNDPVWVRGIISLSDAENSYASVIKFAFIALPFLVLLGTAGGYIIIKKAFKPIDKISVTAEKISEGKDLSERIALETGEDEVHKLAAAFDKMLSRLEQSFETQQQFTSDASHELRTPISVILAQSEYALSDAKTESEYKESLEVINRQAGRMSHIISRLLQLARMDKNTINAEFEAFNLSELVTLICGEYYSADQNLKNISLEPSIEPDIYVSADRSLISRLILNLINNAYQYGMENGFIKVVLVSDEMMLQLSVKDNGIGISENEKDKIWNRFYRADESRSIEDEHLGLGLSIVKEIVKVHDGEIHLISEPGKGSTFIFRMKKYFLF